MRIWLQLQVAFQGRLDRLSTLKQRPLGPLDPLVPRPTTTHSGFQQSSWI
jgi:hypothetical protein